jgi:hypothetical protein
MWGATFRNTCYLFKIFPSIMSKQSYSVSFVKIIWYQYLTCNNQFIRYGDFAFIYPFIPFPCTECDDSVSSLAAFPFLSVIYIFLPPFSTNYSSNLPHFILPSISWSTAWTYFQIQTQSSSGNSITFNSFYMSKPK